MSVATPLVTLTFLPSLRSDRNSHEFVSDEEDGDYETLEQPFENFTTTTPRMSSESLRLQLEEDSCGSGAESKKDRDSGIVESETVLPTPVQYWENMKMRRTMSTLM